MPPNSSPVVDGRSREELRAELLGRIPHYTPEWTPGEDDVGAALVDLAADITVDVTDRLDRVPHKGFVAFLDALGFERAPPQPAQVPLAFEVVETVPENVPIPAGTTVLAPGTDGAPEQSFEIAPEEGFEATPARLTDVLSADPATDQLRSHLDRVNEGASTTLFAGPSDENLQQHRLYIGHADLLTLSASSTIWVEFDTDADPHLLTEGLTWEFFGTASADDEEPAWHELQPVTETTPVPLNLLLPPAERYAVARYFEQNQTLSKGAFASVVDTVVSDFLMADIPFDLETFDVLGFGGSGPGPTTDGGFDIGDIGDFDIGDLHEALAAATLEGAFVDLSDATVDSGTRAEVLDFDVWDGTATQWVSPAAREALREQAADLGVPLGSLDASGVLVGLEFPAGAEIAETTVEGEKSRWIRCAIADRDDPWDRLSVRLDGVGLLVGVLPANVSDSEPTLGRAIEPDLLLRNDVPLPATGEGGEPVYPLGEAPRTLDTFYVASEDAFSKRGETVQLGFAGLDDADASTVELSWEYFDGEGWRTLDRSVAKPPGAALLSGSGANTSSSLSFDVPSDLAPTTVAGHEGHWIRARLVDGHYGQPTYEQTATTDYSEPISTRKTDWEYTTSGIDPPSFTELRLRYTQRAAEPAEHLYAENNRAYSDDLAESAPFSPFEALGAVTEGQTVFLGFDRPLEDGPVQLFVSLPDVEYDPAFHPRVRWEATAEEGWRPLATRDGTESLTRSGLLGLTFAEPTTTRSLFGRERTWVRGRVTRTPFAGADVPGTAGGETTAGNDDGEESDDAAVTECGVEPCARRLETTPLALATGTAPPELLGLALNAGWAANVRTVADEPLGSSDGTQNQTFDLAAAPVTEATVLVDELATLSTAERERLEAERPETVTAVRGPDEALTAFWVEWTAVEDLLGSGPDDRHYHLDRVSGRVTFGDGTRGRVPPIGDGNVEATYRTGGGTAGNVSRGTVTELVSAIPFVDGVENPVAADGGADVESTDAVLERGPRAIRDRGRAVAAPDFERLARAASRKVARARCIPGLDGSGGNTAGWVTVLVVPETNARKPTPSVELRRQVRETLADAAPASLVAADRLVVRGPAFVEAEVGATVVATAGESLSSVESDVEAALTAHLNPLTGRDGVGWEFGELPCLSDLYALIEGVESVDHVEALTLTLEGSGDPITVGEGADLPGVSDDVLVYSGVHDVVATLPATEESG